MFEDLRERLEELHRKLIESKGSGKDAIISSDEAADICEFMDSFLYD